MKVKYDFHIHSALSPCADNDMTPCNVVGFAKLCGLDMIACADHNSIFNVQSMIKVGENYGVTVVPAMELQTAEDIHILCLFPKFSDLKNFYDSIDFTTLKNRPEIFGEQLILDEDDNLVEKYEQLLLIGANISSTEVKDLADKFNGIAIPAHIDRDENGMVAILGLVTEEFKVVELSKKAQMETLDYYRQKYKVIVDSDAHQLLDIVEGYELELKDNTAQSLIDYLKS